MTSRKSWLTLALLLWTGVMVKAQNGSATQVQWTYTAKKIADKTYEVHMSAKIGAGWHLYAQNAGDGPVSTTFQFYKESAFGAKWCHQRGG